MGTIAIRPEILVEVPYESLPKFVKDDRYGFQEKFNGKRRMVVRDGDSVFSFNKEGEIRELPARMYSKILSHRLTRFVIDCELMVDETVKVFDALILDEHLLGTQPYSVRHEAVRIAFSGCKWAEVAYTATTTADKRLFAQRLEGENAEGIVIRRLDAPYKQGDSGQHKKIKLWKTADAVVMSYERKDNFGQPTSVNIGCYDKKGQLQRISGSSLLGKDRTIKPGDVVEIKFLYSTPTGHVVQPTILCKRDDKKPTSCTMERILVYRNKNWK